MAGARRLPQPLFQDFPVSRPHLLEIGQTAGKAVRPLRLAGAGFVELAMVRIVVRGAKQIDQVEPGIASFARRQPLSQRSGDIVGEDAGKTVFPMIELGADGRSRKGAETAL